MFEGVSVAVATPFKNQVVDEPALRRLIRHILGQGVHGLVATGSTGEGATLSIEEKERVWTIAVEEAKGRAFVLAGAGTNSTRDSISVSERALALGVDGVMAVAPYYNKPSQDGMKAHFQALADAVGAPIVLYNVPGRTGVNLRPQTVVELSEHPQIVAVKEASGSLDQATEILAGSSLTVLSGDDSLTLPMMAVGASGVVSVAAHLAGAEMVRMVEAVGEGSLREAASIHRRIYPLVRALFLETNPAPLKAALAGLGLIENELRLPLVPAGEDTRRVVSRELERLGLISSRAG